MCTFGSPNAEAPNRLEKTLINILNYKTPQVMKKKLFTLLVCAFAAISANAWTVSFNADRSVATITSEANNSNNWSDISYTGLNEGEDGATLLKAAETLNFVSGASITSLEAFQSGGFAATTVDFSGATFVETNDGTITYQAYNPQTKQTEEKTVQKTKNAMTFKYFKNCSTAVLANVKTLCQSCFDNNGAMTSTFTIPETVEVIAGHAVDNTPIKSITIPDNVKYIENQGFQNADIKALIDVTVEGYTAAANGAFDKQTTVGQTDADYPDYATLHFPEGAEEYFQNMDDKLDVATSLNKGKFQAWLNHHYEAAATCSEPNGWKEFMNSGSGDPVPVPSDNKVVLRTFSDNVARLVPINFRAYLVTGATKGDDGNYTVALQQIFAIPANTGVILYGEVKADETGFNLSHIKYWDPGESDYVAPYNRTSGIINDAEDKPVLVKNYMVPTVEQTTLYPFYKDATSVWEAVTVQGGNWPLPNMKQYYNKKNTGTVTDRNFILSNLKTTSLSGKQEADYVGLFRVIAGTKCGPNKAYLSLPADVFDSPAGAEALVIKPTGVQAFRSDKWNDPFPGNWGQRGEIGVLQAKYAGEIFEEETTGIKNVTSESVDGGYYTLQGVKVAQPQKGVYVKNGKKVIIK